LAELGMRLRLSLGHTSRAYSDRMDAVACAVHPRGRAHFELRRSQEYLLLTVVIPTVRALELALAKPSVVASPAYTMGPLDVGVLVPVVTEAAADAEDTAL